MPHTKLAPDLRKVTFLAGQVGTGALRSDYFQTGQKRQIARDLVLHSNGEVGVFASRTKIFERQNRNRPFDLGGRLRVLIQPGSDCNRSDD